MGHAGSQAAEAVRESAAELASQGAQRVRRWEQAVETSVRAHPTRWLLIAAGAGIGVGVCTYFWLNRAFRD